MSNKVAGVSYLDSCGAFRALMLLLLCVPFSGHARTSIDSGKSVLITDPRVVDSREAKAPGPFGFTNLLSRLRPHGSTLTEFVQGWLTQWEKTELNGYALTARPKQRLLGIWPQDSSGDLNLAAAPFRLLAIVNRIDQVDLAGRADDIGELRFVFGAFNPKDERPLEFTVILEYKLPKTKRFPTKKAWAEAFAGLSALSFGAAFNHRLTALTRTVTNDRANFLQLRTNDFHLKAQWELREFSLDDAGQLTLSTTAQTPAKIYAEERADELKDWMMQNEEAILAHTAVLPLRFLSGSAEAAKESFSWLRGEGLDETLRERFSRMTCNGCHTADTRTVFTHIKPRRRGVASVLSVFLQKEVLARKKALEDLLD